MTTDISALAKKIDRLLQQSDGVEPHIFDASEVADLQRVLAFVRRIDALGWWGKWLFYAMVAIGTVFTNWDRILGVFRQ